MDVQGLIAKLETTSGGSKELDAEIADAVGVASRSRHTASGKSKGREWFVDSHGSVQTWAQDPPPYTTSLDAALTLVPEVLLHLSEIGADGLPYAVCGNPSDSTEGKGIGATLPLALTIAALKARAS